MKIPILALVLSLDALFLVGYAMAFFRDEAPAQDSTKTAAPANTPDRPDFVQSEAPRGDGTGPAPRPEAVKTAAANKETLDPKDSKEVLDPKEILDPIADQPEAIGEFTEAVKTGSSPLIPSTEFPKDPPAQKRSKKKQGFLAPPNPANLAPPVVSPETPL